jgi:hypothetical protein
VRTAAGSGYARPSSRDSNPGRAGRPGRFAAATHSRCACRRRLVSPSGATSTWSLIAWRRCPQSGHVYVAGFKLRTGRIEYQSAGSSRERERRVTGHLRPHIGESDDAAVAAARGTRDASDLPPVVQERRVVLRHLAELDDA